MLRDVPGGRYGRLMDLPGLSRFALVVVDVQQGFGDAAYWGTRNNPDCDDNIRSLVEHWSAEGRPLVYVRHDSSDPSSPLHPSSPGNQLKDYLRAEPDLVVHKSVNSSFHGTPDLDAWLRETGADGIVVCGITTNHCCETTARVGGNLGHRVLFALDATHTFDRTGPFGDVVSADELMRITGVNLHDEFATVVRTADLVP
jgi:nicotinamidase-related amidase